MSANLEHSHSHSMTPRELISDALAHIDHILPAQGPILNFVHHNTIHGFQHLPFEEALAEVEKLTGIVGYLPEPAMRQFYEKGRITDTDIFAALAEKKTLDCEGVFCSLPNQTIYRKTVYRLALLFDFSAITSSQFTWQMQTLNALNSLQSDVPQAVRECLFLGVDDEKSGIYALWQVILAKLNLSNTLMHSEDLLNLTSTQIDEWFAQSQFEGNNDVGDAWSKQANGLLTQHFSSLGESFTLRGLVNQLTGVDCLQFVQPQLIRLCASALDEGIASWSLPERHQLGLYGAWRAMLSYDVHDALVELPTAQQIIDELPESAIDTIILHLSAHHIPQEKWAVYLQRLALELPGWAGMINWREHHGEYSPENDVKPKLADFLAIRLTLDRLWLDKICQETWHVEAKLDKLQAYFEKNTAEFDIRFQLYNGHLPEYLSHQAQELMQFSRYKKTLTPKFQQLADVIWTWQHSPLAEKHASTDAVYTIAWRAFRLCQHLGLNAANVNLLSEMQLRDMLHLLDEFTQTERHKIWLVAYECHYREQIFQCLTENHLRGRWYQRKTRPTAQLIFCMDEREESFRRHVEELNHEFETFGAAGFFGVAMQYKSVDEEKYTPLCPVTATPTHFVYEREDSPFSLSSVAHQKGYIRYKKYHYMQYQSVRRYLFSASFYIAILAPINLIELVSRTIMPRMAKKISSLLHQILVPSVSTSLHITATSVQSDEQVMGFSDDEQALRVANFLRTIGLTSQFAQIVCFIGHGSTSQNNPHESAHDCGACGGKQGGANARAIAAMANRLEIRLLLKNKFEIVIPDDCWFVGSQHDTCSDDISWYDTSAIPLNMQSLYENFKTALLKARDSASHERCRRLRNRQDSISHKEAREHVKQRSSDLSQVRPEFGHATNAFAVVGRRALTQGAFFDRRAFLISYDPTQDLDGKILEGILLAVGPVGAGINLEYYFSTVNNERLGCGTKIPHNITGLFAVMEGSNSDLRTGLPRQMIEIHEAMRLQIIVEAKTSVLEQIYVRQPSLIELIGGGWVHLSAKDPDSDAIFVFERGVGFVRWENGNSIHSLPMYETSPEYYRNHSEPLSPVLIAQPN